MTNHKKQRREAEARQAEILRRLACHAPDCSVNQPGYVGGPCTCGLVPPGISNPIRDGGYPQ